MDELVQQFIDITGTTPAIATNHLTATNQDLEEALANYFLSAEDSNLDQEMNDESIPIPTLPTAQPIRSTGGGNTLSGLAAGPMPSNWSTGSGSSSRSSTPNRNPIRSNQPARVSTLSDLSRAAPPPARSGNGGFGGMGGGGDSDDESEGEREQAEFFTGGEKSGLSVENPNAGRKTGAGSGAGDIIKGILQKAKEASGAAASAGAANAGGAAPGRSVFGGTAHTLGSDETPSVQVGAPTPLPGAFPSSTSSLSPAPPSEPEEVAIRNLTFWEDGFSIEDGDLMKYSDPGNEAILAAINNGRAPLSLLKVRNDQPVELRIAKRLNEKWVRGESKPKGPWEGSGNRLGSETGPAVISVSGGVGGSESREEVEKKEMVLTNVFEIDAALPVTTLQLRLRSGERLIARFNHSHTIGDIRRYINAAQPGQGASFYALQTTFPSKDLVDENQTIADAGILGSVIVQRSL